jgi:hypothetical protein
VSSVRCLVSSVQCLVSSVQHLPLGADALCLRLAVLPDRPAAPQLQAHPGQAVSEGNGRDAGLTINEGMNGGIRLYPDGLTDADTQTRRHTPGNWQKIHTN